MEPLLDVRDMSAGYGPIQAVNGVSMHVARNEIVAVLGANGAGKSTLLRAISGILKPAAGQVSWQGTPLQGARAHEIARRGIVHVPEGRGIFPELTVEETLRLGAFALPKGGAAGRPAIGLDQVFALFPILAERRRQMAGTLSGGQQQMLAIGRGLLARPLLLILDEPLLGLSPSLSQEVLAKLRGIVGLGVSVLLVEQNAGAAMRVADRVYVMAGGQIVMQGAAAELASAEGLHHAYLGTKPNTSAAAPATARSPTPAAAVALAVDGLQIRFGGNTALSAVALQVREGETVGLIGPNGAGKSTLINCVAGFLSPDMGTIAFFGQDLRRLPPHRRVRLGLTRTFQNLQLFGTMTVLENVRTAVETAGHSGTAAARDADRLIELFGIGHLASAPTASLPYGVRKLVELARCLGTGTKLLLLDEPAAGLNTAEKENVAQILRRVIAERGLSVLLVEHDMPMVQTLADRVYVLDAGRCIAQGSFGEVVRDPQVVRAYLGESWA